MKKPQKNDNLITCEHLNFRENFHSEVFLSNTYKTTKKCIFFIKTNA
jgi:hypothetical protein